MKIRIAKKILKNSDNLTYGKHQIDKAERTVSKWKKNAPVAEQKA
jgi:hypothetical protein